MEQGKLSPKIDFILRVFNTYSAAKRHYIIAEAYANQQYELLHLLLNNKTFNYG